MVEIVILRPDVLRHSGDHAQQKAKGAIQPLRVKQAPMAAFVHERKHAQREQTDQQDDSDGEPQGNSGAYYGRPPQQRKRAKGGENLCQPPQVAGLGMFTDDDPLLLFNPADR